MDRTVYLPALMLGAAALVGCAETPANNANCEYRTSASGDLECVPVAPSGATTTPGSGSDTSGSGTSGSGVPDLSGGSSGGVPDLSGGSNPSSGGVPDLSGTSTAPSASGSSTGAPSGGTTTAPGGGAATDPGGSTTTDPGGGVTDPGTSTDDGMAVADDSANVTDDGALPADDGAAVADDGAVATDDSTVTDPPASAVLARIQVAAGTLARDHSVVTFPAPFADGLGKNLVLEDAQGGQLPLQVNPIDGNFTFVLPSLGAGEQVEFSIIEAAAPLPAGMTAAVEGDHLFVKTPQSTVFRWTLIEDNFRGAAARDVRKGYIYPVYTPGGLNVADDYQVDHPHMHGIWSAWTYTSFRGHTVDFWNGYANQGRVDLDSMEGLWSGPVHAGLVANLDHIDITTTPNVVALNEKWVVTVYKTHDDPAPYFIYDVDSVQEAATTDPLVLEQYHYGGFGYRGSEEWQDPANMAFLTSEGHTRANGDGQNARWCAQYGTVGGKRAGYAAFDHPTNFRHPQGLRIHPTNPYWAFVPVTPLKGGRFSIEQGQPYHSLYRIVAFDGDANPELLNRLWDDFATPPTVTVLP